MRISKWLFGVCLSVLVVMGMGMRTDATLLDASGVYEYEENSDGTVTITKYSGSDETIVVPSKMDGKAVKVIGKSAFHYCDTIKHVVISEGIVELENSLYFGSFGNCYNLKSVSLPNTLKAIGGKAFDSCRSLKTINLPDGLICIGERAFHYCDGLESIVFPESLQSIGKYAFETCSALFKVTIPGNIKTIEQGVFRSCSNLWEVEIQDGVEKIEISAFKNGNRLQKVTIPKSVTYINEFAFHESFKDSPKFTIYADSDSYASTFAKKYGIKFVCANKHEWGEGVITVEPTITSEGEKTYTCKACGAKRTAKTAKAAIPKKGKKISEFQSGDIYKVTKAGTKNGTVEYAKAGTSEPSASVPDSVTVSGITYKVTSVAKDAFKNSKKLKKVTIGKNVTKIGANAFSGCGNLKTVTIQSKKIKSIGKNAFKGISPKARIKVPSGKLGKYKRLMKGKGQKSTVKITK